MPVKALIEDRRRRKVCVECGNPKESDTYTHCSQCLRNYRNSYRKRVHADEVQCERCGITMPFRGSRRAHTCRNCKPLIQREQMAALRIKRWSEAGLRTIAKVCAQCRKPFDTAQQTKEICYDCTATNQKQAVLRWKTLNPGRIKEIAANRKEKSPIQKRHLELMRRYNISIDDLMTLYESQKNKCAICDRLLQVSEGHLDHSHSSKIVRGILCRKCNMGIGLFGDEPALLYAAIAYLERSS